ncbi:MAG TPA: NAD-dependent epimerase/dehydratase family protein, partial [Gemmatimonadaceae bacterium]|nr:NAD-dependent epimerase/dehydratase family protein [Gemmatimonadaceae bacterium]
MSDQTFSRSLRVPVPVRDLFAWHERPGAFERLAPPWQDVRVLSREGGIRDGATVTLEVRTLGVPSRWTVRHRDYVPDTQFVDEMHDGPFARWVHTHGFAPDGAHAAVLTDAVQYALPLDGLGDLVAGGFVRRTLERTFRYRHAVTAHDLARHAAFADRPRLRVAVTGATGFIGQQLCAFLTTGGHEVLRIGRGAVRRGVVDVSWDPARGVLDAASLEGVDAVIHLAGAPIAERWTPEHKRAIVESRVQGTDLVARTIAGLSRRPAVLLSGSAIGIYGAHRGDEVLDESSADGDDFLAETSRAWE